MVKPCAQRSECLDTSALHLWPESTRWGCHLDQPSIAPAVSLACCSCPHISATCSHKLPTCFHLSRLLPPHDTLNAVPDSCHLASAKRCATLHAHLLPPSPLVLLSPTICSAHHVPAASLPEQMYRPHHMDHSIAAASLSHSEIQVGLPALRLDPSNYLSTVSGRRRSAVSQPRKRMKACQILAWTSARPSFRTNTSNLWDNRCRVCPLLLIPKKMHCFYLLARQVWPGSAPQSRNWIGGRLTLISLSARRLRPCGSHCLASDSAAGCCRFGTLLSNSAMTMLPPHRLTRTACLCRCSRPQHFGSSDMR